MGDKQQGADYWVLYSSLWHWCSLGPSKKRQNVSIFCDIFIIDVLSFSDTPSFHQTSAYWQTCSLTRFTTSTISARQRTCLDEMRQDFEQGRNMTLTSPLIARWSSPLMISCSLGLSAKLLRRSISPLNADWVFTLTLLDHKHQPTWQVKTSVGHHITIDEFRISNSSPISNNLSISILTLINRYIYETASY